MSREGQIQTVRDLVNGLLEEEPGYFLVDVTIRPVNNIKVFLDVDTGVVIERCVAYNRKLYNLITETGLFPDGEFSLEVSSPGIDEPLKMHRQYVKNIGRLLEVTQVEGDVEIAEGVRVIFSPGHTVGGQSVAVNTAHGRAVITGFCCNAKNFPAKGPAIAPGVHINLAEAYDTIQKIRAMADILIPIHDPAVGRKKCIPE